MKAYSTPTLAELGHFDDLTQDARGSGAGGNGGGKKNGQGGGNGGGLGPTD